MASISTNSQIKFLHGTQTALNGMLKTGGESGTFYLTRDTRRLYVGLDDKSIVPVNEGIVTYDTLPQANSDNAGQFAYLKGNGVLAVSNGVNWIHLNPNTNTTYSLTGIEEGAGTETITIKTQLKETGVETPIGSHSFSFTGANGTILDIVNGKITVYGTTLAASKVSTSEFKIALKNKNGVEASSASIQVSGDLSVSENSGKILITNTSPKLNNAVATVTPGSTEEGFTIKATETNGTVSNYSGGKINPKITIDGGTTKIPFVGGVADLTAAIQDKITAAKHGFDAMTYKGTCTALPTGTIANGDTYKAASNFTFKDAANKTHQVYTGDLVIASGSETNGAITGAITWDVVPSGNEDTTYSVVGGDNGITIKEHKGGDTGGAPIGGLAVKGGTNITIAKGGTGNNVELTVNHGTVSCSTESETGEVGGGATYSVSSQNVEVVQEQTISGTGHVTAMTTKTWTLRDTNAKLDTTITTGVTATKGDLTTGFEEYGATSSAKVTVGAKLYRSNGETNTASGNFSVKSNSGNIAVAADGTNVTLKLVWGTFGSAT